MGLFQSFSFLKNICFCFGYEELFTTAVRLLGMKHTNQSNETFVIFMRFLVFGLLSNLSINRRKLVDSMWWVVSLSLSLNFFRVADDNSMVLDVEGMKSITNCVNQFNRLVILYVFRVWWCDEWVRMWVSSVSVVNVWELNLLDSTILCSSIEVFCIWGLR